MRLRFKVERQNKPLDPWKIVFERECTMSAAFVVPTIEVLKVLYASLSPIRVVVYTDIILDEDEIQK